MHSSYVPNTVRCDLAIIRLTKDIKMNKKNNVKIISLPPKDYEINADNIIVGLGKTSVKMFYLNFFLYHGM